MRIISKIRTFYLRHKYKGLVKVGSHTKIVNSIFEGQNSVADKAVVMGSIIGQCSYIGPDSSIISAKIGKYCSIADHVSICTGNHPTDFLTTHPAFYYDTSNQIGFTLYKGSPMFDDIYKRPAGEEQFSVLIGNDVWIGSHVLILGGIKIGDGAIIGAGAVVTKDVPPYSIVGGVPAKVIRYRFGDDTILFLKSSHWWDKSYNEICDIIDDFNNLKKESK